MAETIDDATILNRALARIGAGDVAGRDEDSELAAQAWSVYDDTVETAFGCYAWKWCLRTVALDRLAAGGSNGAPANGWAYGFNAPAGALGGPQALFLAPRNPGYPLRDFQVEGGIVYANADTLWGRYALKIEPALWPPLFRTALTTWLAAELAVPVTHDKDLAATLRQAAIGSPSENFQGGLMGRAIALDTVSSGDPQPILAADPLTAVHNSAGGGPLSGPWYA